MGPKLCWSAADFVAVWSGILLLVYNLLLATLYLHQGTLQGLLSDVYLPALQVCQQQGCMAVLQQLRIKACQTA